MSAQHQDIAKVVAGAAVGAGILAAVRNLSKYSPPKVWKESEIRTDHGSNTSTSGAQTEKALKIGKHAIQLYGLATPNGAKPGIMLEEICEVYPDFDYDAWTISISGEQFTSGFVEVNPNSKIPALLDQSTTPPTRVFESGAILMYLAEKYPKTELLPTEPSQRAECLSWLFWAMGSPPYLGGGFGHFYAYAKEKQEYPINRFTIEAKRQLDLLDKHLAKNQFICGDKYTVADVAIWPWYGATALGRMYNAAEFLSVHEYTNIIRWAKQLENTRPAVRRGRMLFRSGPDNDKPAYKGIPGLPERHSRTDWEKK